MDLALVNIDCTFVYIDDIFFILTMKILDKANLQLKVDKCKITCEKIEWLGYEKSGSAISPVNGKVQGISEKLRPTSIKKLKLFLGAVNQLNKLVPDLASSCFPFRSILKKDNPWIWNSMRREAAFLKVNQELEEITELTHFKRDRPIRIVYDASKEFGNLCHLHLDSQLSSSTSILLTS